MVPISWKELIIRLLSPLPIHLLDYVSNLIPCRFFPTCEPSWMCMERSASQWTLQLGVFQW